MAKISKNVRQRVLEESDFSCMVCKVKAKLPLEFGNHGYKITDKSGVYITVDHILPLALNGTNREKNLIVLCSNCNRDKAAIHPLIWFESLPQERQYALIKEKIDDSLDFYYTQTISKTFIGKNEILKTLYTQLIKNQIILSKKMPGVVLTTLSDILLKYPLKAFVTTLKVCNLWDEFCQVNKIVNPDEY